MSDFDTVEFVGNPSVEELRSANVTKDDLKYIATSFRIPFTHSTTKDQLKALILAYLGDTNVTHSHTPIPDPQVALEIEKVKLQAMQLKLQYELAERDSTKLKIQQQEKDREEREAERAREERLQERQLEEAREQRQHELQVLQLQQGNSTREGTVKFDVSKHIKLLPAFSEKNPEAFFREFESTASHFQWPEEHWVWLLKPKLVDKALEVCDGIHDNTDYVEVKKAILDAYSISSEGYRQAFRSLNKPHTQTYTEFAAEKLRAFKRWLKSASVNTFDELVNLMVLEEFKRKVPYSIMAHITDKEETDLIKASKIADVFSLIHRSQQGERKATLNNVRSSAGSSQSSYSTGPVQTGAKPFQMYCRFCKKEGHFIKDCPDPRCKISNIQHPRTFTKPVASTNLLNTCLQNDLFQAFRSTGSVSLGPDMEQHPVDIIRDTASAQSLILKTALPGIDRNLTGEKVYLQVLHSSTPVKLAKIQLDCEVIKDAVIVGVVDTPLPIPNATFLLGNDLAGSLVVPRLTIRDSPLPFNPTEDIEKEQPTLFPHCAITRAQGRRAADAEEPAPPFLPKPAIGDSAESGQDGSNQNSLISEQNLEEAQKQDPTLKKLHQEAVPKDSILHPPAYYYQDNMLMRFYRPPKLTDEDTWAEVHQVVVPQSVRRSLMEVAHEGFSGHLGIKKTYLKLLNDFYWPGMKKDVATFVNSCFTCQLVGKPNQTIPPYPLQPIKVPSEPFQKIIIDIVGPLPKTKKNNQYLLTILCPTSRYPEAYPLKNITAKSVASKLIHMFTTFGIPQEVQSDRGTNFTSNLFQQVLHELGIQQTLSTAYHPQSQGALERHHQTLKAMLRKYCHENNQEWDEGLPFLLFAIREVTHESTGCSPFELVFGRKVRGPLKVMKDKLIGPPIINLMSVTKYIEQLKGTLEKVRNYAKDNLKTAQTFMKSDYDLKAKTRVFHEGDKVLAYFPIPGSPLSAKYHGPYTVKRKLNELNYIIYTPDRLKTTQLVHINLLKPYLTQEPAPDQLGLTCNVINPCTDEILETSGPNVYSNDSNSSILQNLPNFLSHLNPTQVKEVSTVLHNHSDVLSDIPGHCTIMSHDVILAPGTNPIRQPPYRLPHHKREQMKKEVDYLVDHGLAVPSCSPWASPCLLVPKEGGQLRLCTDYRRVNTVTQPDPYPLPRIDDLIDTVGQSKFISKIDLLKGYHQIPLTDNAQLISAFITPFGLYHYQVMPFGMRNSPATFQRTMNFLFQGLEGVQVYLDDIIIFSDTWSQHVDRLISVLRKLQDAHLTIKLAKTSFCSAMVTYLGHDVGHGRVRPKSANVEAILAYPTPHTKKSLMRFLGMAGFYRRYCPNFSTVVAPLTRLTSGRVVFEWSDACQIALDQLKTYLARDPVLVAPDFTLPFTLQTDASDVGLGAVLLQKTEDVFHPVAYHSAKFNKHQMSYSVIEKELLAIVSAIKKFECYLYGSQKLQVYTDHNPLTFLNRNKFSNQRLLRWSLFLQPYDLQVMHILGSENKIADALSRA